jgi:CubicO group peptidase (beta-lactamase class C family)
MCYWGGWGGSLILVDQDRRVTVSFVMNRMVSTLMGDPRTLGIMGAAEAGFAGLAR